jgi:acyl-CoA synthetase (AMP-forming)/AMP-acid ligase II
MIGYQLSVNAARSPDAIAVAYGNRQVTYRELNVSACRMANGLLARGVGPGERVAALLHNCPQFLVALFAAAKVGVIFVPINFRLTAREIGVTLDARLPKVLLAGQGFAQITEALRGRPSRPGLVIDIDDRPPEGQPAREVDFASWLRSQDAAEPDMTIDSGEPLLLTHTSGTTGLPKGAL